MIVRRHLLLAALGAMLSVAAAMPAWAQDPGQFVGSLAERAIAVLKQPGMSDQQREAQFRVIFNDGFDVPAIGRYVLGVHWRGASEDQRAEYLRLFEGFIVKTYADRLRDYSGQQVQVGRAAQFDNTFMVDSEIVGGGKAPIKVVWQVERRGGGFKITDVVIEGVSLGLTQRSDFSSYINQNGGRLDALMAELRKRAGS